MSVQNEPKPHGPARNGLTRFEETPALEPAFALPPPAEGRTQAPAESAAPAKEEFAFHDLKTRNRNGRGDREPWSYTYGIPTTDADETPLEQTPLIGALKVIEAILPGRASTLHHYYNRKLGLAQKRQKEVRAEEEAALARRNAQAAEFNAALDRMQAAMRGQQEAAIRSDRDALAALDEPLRQAHDAAAERVARTGGLYDSTDPTETSVLRYTPRALEEVAPDLGLPGPHGDARAHLPGWLGWFLTIAVGVFIGMSLGIITHVLHANIGYLERNWPATLVCAVLGIAISAAIKWGTRVLWYLVGQDLTLRVSTRRWRTVLTLAAAGTLTFGACDAAAERQGLLALAQVDSATRALSAGSTAPSSSSMDVAVLWCVALLVTVAYLTCAGVEGYLKGRQEEVLNLVHSRQQSEFTETDTRIRAEETTQDALHAIATVRGLRHRQSLLTTRIAETAAPFDQKIAALEAQRLPERQPMDEQAHRRYQDALDNLHGTQATFDGMFEEALGTAEASSSVWRRLLQAVSGYRPPRRRDRDRRTR